MWCSANYSYLCLRNSTHRNFESQFRPKQALKSGLRCMACQCAGSHPGLSCRGKPWFSLKSWRHSPEPYSNVNQRNPDVKLKIQWNAAPSLEKPKNTHCTPTGRGYAAEHLWDQEASPGKRGPALSEDARGRGEVARQPVSPLARTTHPGCPA